MVFLKHCKALSTEKYRRYIGNLIIYYYSSIIILIVINYVMKSVLLLKLIHVLHNYLILPDTLPFKYFSLHGDFVGNLDSTNKFNDIAS